MGAGFTIQAILEAVDWASADTFNWFYINHEFSTLGVRHHLPVKFYHVGILGSQVVSGLQNHVLICEP